MKNKKKKQNNYPALVPHQQNYWCKFQSNCRKRQGETSQSSGCRSVGAGFSFIEVMMAIFVIAIGILGTFAPLQKAIVQSHESRNQIAASLLAQEGIELIRNLRDNSALQGNKSFADLVFPSDDSSCSIDAQTTSTALICPGSDYKIYDSGVLLSHDSDESETRWSRSVEVAYDGVNRDHVDTTKVNLTVKVWWGDYDLAGLCNSANHCVEAKGELGKWLE